MRAILFATLAGGRSRISSYLSSPDTDAMIKACRTVGATIEMTPEALEIEGGLKPAEDVIDAGNSGQVLRFIGAIAALTSGYTVITGDHSIRHSRPVQPLLDGLTQLGAFAVSSRGDGFAPIVVKGPLRGGTALISGEDSQPVSGLLIAAAFAPEQSEIFVANPGEKPWVALTLSWFDRLGISYTNDDFEKYTLQGNGAIEGFSYAVPGDVSSAAYPIAAAVLTNSELLLTNIDMDDVQGDKELIFQLQRMGAKIDIDRGKREIRVRKGSALSGAKIDVNGYIDSVTLLAVVGCFAEGATELTGAKIARSKECDRIASIVGELRKMGANIHEKEDGLVVERSQLRGARLSSCADHRMALALSVAALCAQGESCIDGAECVSKSYAAFFEQLKNAGASIDDPLRV